LKSGRRVLFRRQDVEEYIEAGHVPARS
jgi:hypothetical protein